MKSNLLNVSCELVLKKSTIKRNSLVAASERCFITDLKSTSYGNFNASAVATCTSIGSVSIYKYKIMNILVCFYLCQE